MNIKPNKNKALMLAKRQLAILVQDAVALEGIHFTLPEIQTLLDGITVGGHKLSDQQIATNQAKAWKQLFDDVKSGKFKLSKEYVCSLHQIAGFEEALEHGQFRSGQVTISGTDSPPPANELDRLFLTLVESSSAIGNVYERAIHLFLEMARSQFFYDVNKHMGHFMMNGTLLMNGFPVINISAKKQLEFNQLMLAYYGSHNEKSMFEFLTSCLDEKIIEIMNE